MSVFFLIDQITCSLNFLELFHHLFHLQEEFRRYHIKNGDRRVKHKFGEFFNFTITDRFHRKDVSPYKL